MSRRHVPLDEPERIELEPAQLNALLERAKVLGPEDHQKIKGAFETLAYVTRELDATTVNLARLRRFLFGASEKTSKILDGAGSSVANAAAPTSDTVPVAPAQMCDREAEAEAEKKPGHGRNGADAYIGARKIPVPHPRLHHGDACPECRHGKVYTLKEPRSVVRVTAVAPVNATVWECEELRCGTCNHLFPAPPPPGVGSRKYDDSVAAMIAELKYGVGLPFNRIEKVQHDFGIPLPAATQWDLVNAAADRLFPVFQELVRQGAAGDVLHNDDTSMRVLELSQQERDALLGHGTDDRTGVYTSGIVSVSEGHQAALYYTGPRHSGENLAKLIQKRAAALPTPIQMCDALAANTSGDFDAIVAACLVHARRNFVDVATTFPQECQFVLEKLRAVYRNEAEAKNAGLSSEERLAFHQERSQPLMEMLHQWLAAQTAEHKVEPNASLGQAIAYMERHWGRLTLFLRKAGAPLDNNICERALKKVILHRKNSLFFKTLHGAAVGDLFMSFIHTAELNGVSPFAYLVAVLRNAASASERPRDWLPWNFDKARAQGPSP